MQWCKNKMSLEKDVAHIAQNFARLFLSVTFSSFKINIMQSVRSNEKIFTLKSSTSEKISL